MRFRDRLSYKQARITVAIAFLLGLILGLFQVAYDYKAQSEGIDASIKAYLDTSS